MNETIELLLNRKSTRDFTDDTITDEQKQLLFECALAAPSGGNEEAYSIIDIVDQDIKDELADLCDHQPFIKKAPVVLIFVTDKQRSVDMIRLYDTPDYIPDEMEASGNDGLIAACNVVMAAESMGLGSCFIGDIKENFERVQELLHLPKYVVPCCMLVIGKPTESQLKRKKPNRFKVEEMVHTNYYHHKDIEETKQMYMSFTNKTEEQLPDYFHRLAKVKIFSDFKKEMQRSYQVMIKQWKSKD